VQSLVDLPRFFEEKLKKSTLGIILESLGSAQI
jgi:hypothetical protein